MNKCADCQFWYNIEHTDMGACRHLFAYKQNDYAPIQIVLRCEDRPVNTETHKHFGCVHFGEKQCGPFHIQRKIGSDLRIGWRMLFNDEIIWAPDLEISQVHRWVKLLNDCGYKRKKSSRIVGRSKFTTVVMADKNYTLDAQVSLKKSMLL